MKIRYVLIAIVISVTAIVAVERSTRVECYHTSTTTVVCENAATGEKWTEKSVNH